MSATQVHELHAADGRVAVRRVSLDSGARLSRALLSYLVVLIASLLLLPFGFVVPERLAPAYAFTPLGTLATLAMFVPYGFLSRRARTGRAGQHVLSIVASGGLLALALETAQLFEPSCEASPWHLLAAMAGAGLGAWLCARAHEDEYGTSNAVHAMLLQLPLMGLTYLLLPLLWASGAAAQGDPARLALTVSIGLMGASILGSVARAIRGYTPDRAPWMVPAVALLWSAIGMLPSLLVDWRITLGGMALITAFASWRGRWSAPPFQERRYETPALLSAAPFMALYFVGAGIWPGHSFRSNPLVHLGMPVSEAGLALALPLLEMGIAATVLGYVVAEFNGRSESALRDILARVLAQACVALVLVEVARSFFGFEGASLLRVVLALGAAAYGAMLYHLQRAHVKVMARRIAPSR
ncbi:MAG: hypothetical protein IT355_00970 [Gemmatimonadaceae bacterium]|nr:hypothetical protein [Gemmatimonadaceae bacterium]